MGPSDVTGHSVVACRAGEAGRALRVGVNLAEERRRNPTSQWMASEGRMRVRIGLQRLSVSHRVFAYAQRLQ